MNNVHFAHLAVLSVVLIAGVPLWMLTAYVERVSLSELPAAPQREQLHVRITMEPSLFIEASDTFPLLLTDPRSPDLFEFRVTGGAGGGGAVEAEAAVEPEVGKEEPSASASASSSAPSVNADSARWVPFHLSRCFDGDSTRVLQLPTLQACAATINRTILEELIVSALRPELAVQQRQPPDVYVQITFLVELEDELEWARHTANKIAAIPHVNGLVVRTVVRQANYRSFRTRLDALDAFVVEPLTGRYRTFHVVVAPPEGDGAIIETESLVFLTLPATLHAGVVDNVDAIDVVFSELRVIVRREFGLSTASDTNLPRDAIFLPWEELVVALRYSHARVLQAHHSLGEIVSSLNAMSTLPISRAMVKEIEDARALLDLSWQALSLSDAKAVDALVNDLVARIESIWESFVSMQSHFFPDDKRWVMYVSLAVPLCARLLPGSLRALRALRAAFR